MIFPFFLQRSAGVKVGQMVGRAGQELMCFELIQRVELKANGTIWSDFKFRHPKHKQLIKPHAV